MSTLRKIIQHSLLALIIIGLSIVLYQYIMLARGKNECMQYGDSHPQNRVIWLDYQCLEVVGGKLRAVPAKTSEPVSKPIDLSGITSLRYPYGKCSPKTYTQDGRIIPGVCDLPGVIE